MARSHGLISYHILGQQNVNELIRELNGYNLNGSNISVQMSTSGVRQKPGMGGGQFNRWDILHLFNECKKLHVLYS